MGHGHQHDHRAGAAVSGVIGPRSGMERQRAANAAYLGRLMTARFMMAEVTGGIISGSLALPESVSKELSAFEVIA